MLMRLPGSMRSMLVSCENSARPTVMMCSCQDCREARFWRLEGDP
jgi:hypothetical protein